jgi:hypothetical protein
MLSFVLAGFVNRGDARMVQRGGCLSLGPEPIDLVSAGQRTVPQQLDGDLPPKTELPRAIDNAHSAACDLLE